MTMGELLFYAGAALLVVTVLLAVLFLLRRPKYVPEGATAQTERLPGSSGHMGTEGKETVVLEEETVLLEKEAGR